MLSSDNKTECWKIANPKSKRLTEIQFKTVEEAFKFAMSCFPKMQIGAGDKLYLAHLVGIEIIEFIEIRPFSPN